ncbi:MAG: biopolymer transporter ExbD [Bdellovibrio sp.]|nr:MAG: biopolymer transporter ExbD [Bdellovibrio sp.]
MASDPVTPLEGGDEISAISSINVTPFVDVVLVLLVIFMITAPLLSKDVLGIKLPKASSGEQKISKNFGVAVTAQGQFLLDGQLTTPESLAQAARQAVQENPDIQALVSADGDAHHADVVRAIDLIRSAGLVHFALQVERP